MNDTNTKEIIPVFFATDDNYVPYLAVALQSMIDNASKDYIYNIHILATSLSDSNKDCLNKFNSQNVNLNIVDVTLSLASVKTKLQLRDYYSTAIYYRLFIADLFPNYPKAIYLDCDIVVLEDISKLYNIDISNDYLAAIPEEVMTNVDIFGDYAEQVLGVNRENYFNSGILLMNLEKFRNDNVFSTFAKLLKTVKFIVAPDQDYLNFICKDNVKLLDIGWNKTPINEVDFDKSDLKIVHYKMDWKPWHYDNVKYGEYFWHYAAQTEYNSYITNIKESYSEESKLRDKNAYSNLIDTAISFIEDSNNYFQILQRI